MYVVVAQMTCLKFYKVSSERSATISVSRALSASISTPNCVLQRLSGFEATHIWCGCGVSYHVRMPRLHDNLVDGSDVMFERV